MSDQIPMNRVYGLIKFFENIDYWQQFKAGLLYCNTPHYFRTIEEIGRSDPYESCIGYYNLARGDNPPKFTDGGGKILNIEKAKQVVIHPLNEPSDGWLQCWAIVAPQNNFDDYLIRIVREFGPYFVYMPAQNIKKYIARIRKFNAESVEYGYVRYSSNPKECSLGVKRVDYEYQCEFRIVIGECDKFCKEHREFRVPPLTDLLLDFQSLKLEKPNGQITHFSFGQQTPITVMKPKIELTKKPL